MASIELGSDWEPYVRAHRIKTMAQIWMPVEELDCPHPSRSDTVQNPLSVSFSLFARASRPAREWMP